MEASGDLFGQLRRGPKIDLGGMDAHMAHIGCQPRQSCVYILSVPVLGQQPVDSKGMSQVVNTGGYVFITNGTMRQQSSEGLIDRDMT